MKRTFDRIPHFDIRSRAFGVSKQVPQVINEQPPVNRLWLCSEYLDQGSEGACVGFACGHELIAGPTVVLADNEKAREIYREARRHDQWEGEDYEGTNMLGGAKAMRHLGYISEFWWCFGLRDLIMTLGYIGPVVLGISWYEGMSNPSPDGLVRPTGQVTGEHGILCQGVNVDYQYFVLHNSWGQDWGHGGNCYVLFSDMELLLRQQGEAMVMIDIPEGVEGT